MLDMRDFANRALFREDPHFGLVGRFEGKDYEIAPGGPDDVVVMDPETGESLGRLTLGPTGFVVA